MKKEVPVLSQSKLGLKVWGVEEEGSLSYQTKNYLHDYTGSVIPKEKSRKRRDWRKEVREEGK